MKTSGTHALARDRAAQAARRDRRAKTRKRATLRTLTLLIPRRYNPDANGLRRPFELRKLIHTVRELRQLFGGYTALRCEGWYRSNAGSGIRDNHFRFEIDALVTPPLRRNLRQWKKILEIRYEVSVRSWPPGM
jgi:hypothetical protein